MAGHHGNWQKQCFYEPAVKVPLMLRLPSGETCRVAQNVSLVDVLPTLLEIADLEVPSDLPGDSLLEIAQNQADETTCSVFSEYHHMGMCNAGFMLKRGDYKLCHYVGSEPQLFNVEIDPLENDDLAPRPECAARRSELEVALRAIVDPELTDARAKENQRMRRSTRCANQICRRSGNYLTIRPHRPNNSDLGLYGKSFRRHKAALC